MYGDMVCTYCNPNSHEHFDFSDPKDPKLNINEATCQELFELVEFEMRTVKVYQDEIKFFIDLGNCQLAETAKQSKEQFNPEKMPEMEETVVKDQYKLFHECFIVDNFDTPECKQLCDSRNLTKYNFTNFNFLTTLKDSLAFLFQFLSKKGDDSGDIEEFYQNIKKKDFKSVDAERPVDFLTVE